MKNDITASNNETLEERVMKLSYSASSVKKKKQKVVRTITRADMNAVNRSIAPKLEQNAAEREMSKQEAYNDDKSWI